MQSVNRRTQSNNKANKGNGDEISPYRIQTNVRTVVRCEDHENSLHTPNSRLFMKSKFYSWKDDPANYEDYLQELRVGKVLNQLSSISESSSDLRALPQGLSTLLRKVEPSSRVQLIEEIQKVLEQQGTNIMFTTEID